MRKVRLLARGPDGEAALRWLQTLAEVESAEHPADTAISGEVDVLWIHGSAPVPEKLLEWLRQGGRLLATLDAADIPFELGLEPVPPDEVHDSVWCHREDEFWLEEFRSFKAFPHIRGLAAFGPHPLFAGLNQGTYTWAPTEGEPYHRTTYRDRRPRGGSTVAVERAFIHLNAERVVAWEYQAGEGGILCIGAFVHPAAPDSLLARQLHAMLANAVTGDAIPHRDRAVPVALWPAAGGASRRDEAVPVPPVPDLNEGWVDSNSIIALTGEVVPDAPWTLAGRRVLLTGSEDGGLAEAWSHPFRVMREISLWVNGKPPVPVSIRVAPEEVTRTHRAGGGNLLERWTTALERPVLVWDLTADSSAELSLRWVVDLRRMWPYPAGAYGDLRWNISQSGERVWVGAAGASVQVVFALVGGCFSKPIDRDDAPAIELTAMGTGRLRLIAAAATESADLEITLRALDRKKLDGLQRQRHQHAEQIGAYGTGVESPDADLSLAFEWAKVRVDSFLAETPGIGRSLLAGYAQSRPGWGDGRPGYAWYFGRDACWTAFAQLAAGDREAPRDVIRFLSLNQDVSGKVLHEYTTSGLVHYDAADSTPLYLLLVARYAAWSGDTEYLRKHWPAIERAYRFCRETDTDQDGLIENTRVGHGWIEHGPLGGAHVTLYLAACWLAALEGLEPVAEAIGRSDLAAELRNQALRARETIRRRFMVNGEYALGLAPEGSPQLHRTAMLAVPLLLDAVDPAETTAWLDRVQGEGFSAPWGVRMIEASNPLFDPAGYHLGAIWPLYTGWVSLAEWKAGRYGAALGHLLANVRLVRERARGAFDEVLHGLVRRSAGVCPDQAWSAAMVLSPVVEGLWGVIPDGLNSEVTVAPFLPPEWTRMSLRRLRVGRTVLDIELRRRPGQLVVRVKRTYGPSILLRLAPRETHPLSVMVDDVELKGPSVQFHAADQHEVIFFL